MEGIGGDEGSRQGLQEGLEGREYFWPLHPPLGKPTPAIPPSSFPTDAYFLGSWQRMGGWGGGALAGLQTGC